MNQPAITGSLWQNLLSTLKNAVNAITDAEGVADF
jgi:hypothetical protein